MSATIKGAATVPTQRLQQAFSALNANRTSAAKTMASGQAVSSADEGLASLVPTRIRERTEALRAGNQSATAIQVTDQRLQATQAKLDEMRKLAEGSRSTGEERAVSQVMFADIATQLRKESSGDDDALLDDNLQLRAQAITDSTELTRAIEQTRAKPTEGTPPTQSLTEALSSADITSDEGIDRALKALDQADATIKQNREMAGSAINEVFKRIEQKSAALDSENAQASIRDVDVAKETAQLSRSQVLQQSAVAMQAQANAQPQLALRLLG